MADVVLDMNDRRPIWAMPPWVPERIREALPEGWTLAVVSAETDGAGDGAGRVAPEALDAVEDARAYLGYGIAPEILRRGRRLVWVHSGAAGVGSSLTPEMKASPVIFTNSAGVHAPPMAETVLGMILFFGRGLDLALANQREGRWSTEPFYREGAPMGELSGATVGILGFGGIGREVGRRVAALGASVLAWKRRPGDREALAPLLTPVGGGESMVDRFEIRAASEGPGALEEVLERSDVVVVTLPDTPGTRGLLDAAALARLKDGALLINVARGKLVDPDALTAELASGRLRGAGLDVFAREPLPPDDPLWRLPNVLITPHVSAVTTRFWERETELILHNLRCLIRGAPPPPAGECWVNVVDKTAGY